MKLRLLIVVMLSLPLFGTNFTVKTSGGNFTDIQTCLNTIQAGDTCTVFAGVSGTSITIPAGSPGLYKTLTVNSGDSVTINSVILNAHTKLIGLQVQNTSAPSGTACITLFNNSSSAASDVYITGNTVQACGTGPGGVMLTTSTQSSFYPQYVYIQNNTFKYACSTQAAPDICKVMFIRGDHWLVENNDISHATTPITIQAGTHHVIRKNTVHDVYGRDPNGQFSVPYECFPSLNSSGYPSVTVASGVVTWVSGTKFSDEYVGSYVTFGADTTHRTVTSIASATSLTVSPAPADGSYTMKGGNGGNCHSDFLASEPQVATQFNLVENNTISNFPGVDSKTIIAQGDGCFISGTQQCHDLIIRYNTVNGMGSTSILNDNAQNGTISPGFYNVVTYNNDWVNTNSYSQANNPVTDQYNHNSLYPSDINNIYYYPYATSALNPIADDPVVHPTATYRNNMAWCSTNGTTTASPCTLYNHTYSTGHFPFDYTACVAAGGGSNCDPGNQLVNPKFTNYAGGDFSLAAGSPAIFSGSYLTTVTGGCGTSTLSVGNASHFQAGDPILGVNSDQIRIGGSTLATVTGVTVTSSHASDSITLSGTAACSPGDPIYLSGLSDGTTVLTGTLPNFGSKQPARSPSVVTLHCSGSGASSAGGFTLTDGVTTTSVTCNNSVASACSATPSGTDGCSNNYANSTSLTVTATAGAGSVLSSIAGGGCSGSPCTTNSGTGNLDLYGTFTLTPTASIAVVPGGCNVLQNSCNVVITLTTTNLDFPNSGWQVQETTGTIIIDTVTGLPSQCDYGTVNALCGDGAHPSGTFTIHATISSSLLNSLAQESATVYASANGVPAACTPSCQAILGQYGGRLAGQAIGQTAH